MSGRDHQSPLTGALRQQERGAAKSKFPACAHAIVPADVDLIVIT